MKQKFKHLQSLLLLLILTVVGTASAWATDVSCVWDFSGKSGQIANKTTSYSSTGTGSATTLYYVGGSSDSYDGSPTYIKMNGKTASTNPLENRYFHFAVPSTSGTLSIEYASSAGGATISTSTNVSTTTVGTITGVSNEECNSAPISSLTQGNEIYVCFPDAKAYIKKITWTYTTGDATTYTVSYNMNGHGSSISSVTSVTAIPNPLPSPTATGWKFGGWYMDSDFAEEAVEGTSIGADTELFAKWVEKANATVSIDPASGSVTVGNTLDISNYVSEGSSTGDITYSSSNTSVATVNGNGVVTGEAEGSATITISQAEDADYKAGSVTFGVTVNPAVTLYTVYSAVSPASAGTVVMKETNSSGDEIASGSSVAAATPIYLSATANPGYTFSTWSIGTQSSSNPFTYPSLNDNKTFQANFTANTYSVHFNANGGSGDMSSQNFTYGTAQNLTSNAFTRSDYTFDGWATSSGGDVVYTDGQNVSNLTTTDGATVELYAKWTATAPANVKTFDYTSSNPGATLTPITVGGGEYNSGHYYNFSTISGSLSITAASGYNIEGVTVTYTSGSDASRYGGTPTLSNTTDYSYSRSSATGTISKTGTARNTITLNFNNKARITSIVVTYSAGSGPATYTVTYNGNGKTSGSVPTDASTYENGATVTVKANTGSLAKDGYDFVGWNTQADGNGTNYAATGSATFTMGSANVTLYAKWSATSDTKQLFHTTFVAGDGWESENIVGGSTTEKTINGTKVVFGCNNDGHKVVVNTSDGGSLKFDDGNKLNSTAGAISATNPNHYMAIYLTDVNGSITVDFGTTSQAWYYTYDDGSDGTVIARQTASTGTNFTIDNLKSSRVTLYLGNKGITINELTITTPKTRLTSDSTQVRFIGNTGGAVSFSIRTNSTGTVGIKTNPNGSYADASYDTSSRMLTITPKAAGTTSVVMRVEANGVFPAKELTIPIQVIAPAITIKTQPSSVSCVQNDATEKKFTIDATVNTGKELAYQWQYYNVSSSEWENIPGAIYTTYTLNAEQKATIVDPPTKYRCKVTSDGCPDKTSNEVNATISAIGAAAYKAKVFLKSPGNSLVYNLESTTTITSGATDVFHATIDGTTLTVTPDKIGKATITLASGASIEVEVIKHKITLIWSADVKEYTGTNVPAENATLLLDNGSNNGLPYLKARLYENGTSYTGKVTFYSDDPGIAYFEGQTDNTKFEQNNPGDKPTIKYGNNQGGCKFYAYIEEDNANGIDSVKVSYDLRIQKGTSNALPEKRNVAVQQQYTLYRPNTDEKLVTVTYGGYKYGNWIKVDSKGKETTVTDAWGSATNYVGKNNAIDGYLYAVRNKDNDAADEYKHAINEEDDIFGSAWYSTEDDSPKGGKYAAYERIKPFRLPCRASYLTFTAHETGTLTAYVYQNGIVGRGGSANQLASGPRLGYWFDEEGWVQEPVGTVVTKQKIANANARDKRSYGDYANMNEQMNAYWTNTADAIVIRKLRSEYCKNASNLTDNLDDYELDYVTHDGTTYPAKNPYYWGNTKYVTDNNNNVVPTPERPIPHQGGYMIVNEGYVKYTIPVIAGKTYYFFGKMTKVGYAGMNFVPAEKDGSGVYTTAGFTGYKHAAGPLVLANDDVWDNTLFGTGEKNVIYDEVRVPSNFRIEKWNTICLPFSVNENQLEQIFGKGTELAIYNGMYHDGASHEYRLRYLRHVDQNILPGQPYMIYPTGRAVKERSNQDNGGMEETGETIPTDANGVIGTKVGETVYPYLSFKNVLINKGVKAQSYGSDEDDKDDLSGSTKSYVFVGNDEPKTIQKYDIYYNVKTGEPTRWMRTNTAQLPAYHAFIQAYEGEAMQDALELTFSDKDVERSWVSDVDYYSDDEATSIIVIEDEGISEQHSANHAYNGKAYNMMGQEVDPNTAKGLVIINGKKVMY